MKAPQASFQRISLKAGEGGSTTKMFRLKSVAADHLVCREFDGTTEGSTDVLVAKVQELRNSILSDNFDGNIVTYSYHPSTVQRTAIWSGNSAIQIVAPPWVVNRLIWAISCDHTGVFVNNVELKYLELNQGRGWIRVFDL